MGYSYEPHIRRSPVHSKPHTRLRQVSEAGYRYYSPSLGRWLSRDPIGRKGGLNLYAFLLNNTPNGYDARGHTMCNADAQKIAGSECCSMCDNEFLQLLDVRRSVRSQLDKLMAGDSNWRSGKTTIASGKCVRGPGDKGQWQSVSWDESVKTCVGKCAVEHESLHQKQCEENEFLDGPFDAERCLKGGDMVRCDQETEGPAYRATDQCITSLLNSAMKSIHDYQSSYGGDMLTAQNCACAACKAAL